MKVVPNSTQKNMENSCNGGRNNGLMMLIIQDITPHLHAVP
jgi:hypothetical protein